MPEAVTKIKARFRFAKQGVARYLSHLDMMRTLQRAMSRAGVPAAHTEGFNPHPYISIPNALSLGYGSLCEIADIEIPPDYDIAGLPDAMNKVLPDGLSVISAYVGGRKAAESAFAGYEITFLGLDQADNGKILELFDGKPVVVLKKSKHKTEDTDIAPLIRSIKLDGNVMRAVTASTNTLSLNPSYIVAAMRALLPEVRFDSFDILRREIFDADGNIFI